MSTLTEMPDEITAGTTVSYQRNLADYPASQGWSLTTYLRGKKKLANVPAASGDVHLVNFPAATAGPVSGTDYIDPGADSVRSRVYEWVEVVAHATLGTYVVARGYVTVLANPNTAIEGALQLSLERQLELIEARLEGRLAPGADMESYGVDAQQVMKIPFEDLSNARANIKEQLRAIAAGGQFGRSVKVYFPTSGMSS